MVTRYGQADIPREVSGRRADLLESKIIVLTVLWNDKWSDLMANYLSILAWRRLPRLWADVTCQVKPEGRRPDPLFNITRSAQNARIRIWLYSIPCDKENRIKITRIYCRLTSCFRRHFAMFGDSSQVRALPHCSNERLEYYAARGMPLWRHNGFCDVINAQSRQNKRAHPYLPMC